MEGKQVQVFPHCTYNSWSQVHLYISMWKTQEGLCRRLNICLIIQSKDNDMLHFINYNCLTV